MRAAFFVVGTCGVRVLCRIRSAARPQDRVTALEGEVAHRKADEARRARRRARASFGLVGSAVFAYPFRGSVDGHLGACTSAAALPWALLVRRESQPHRRTLCRSEHAARRQEQLRREIASVEELPHCAFESTAPQQRRLLASSCSPCVLRAVGPVLIDGDVGSFGLRVGDTNSGGRAPCCMQRFPNGFHQQPGLRCANRFRLTVD